MSGEQRNEPPAGASTPPAGMFPPSTPPPPPKHLSFAPPSPTAASIKAQAHLDAHEAFERRLLRDVLGAERFRAVLLVAIPTAALFLIVVQGRAYPEDASSMIQGRFDRTTVEAFLMVVALFELYVLAWIGKLLKNDQRPGTARRYLHSFVETSLPTAVIVYYAAVDGPVQALLMPSAFVYWIFILLSTLGLDFLLCTFTGFVAAAEYAAIALLWGASDTRVAEPALASPPHHLAKALLLLVGGIAAGFVASRLRRSFTTAIESVGERARILGVFGQHVSPEVVERLVAGGQAEVKSEQRKVCVMFFDIRNFTAFSEQKTAAEVVDYLNVVFDATIAAVVERHGIVNKFLGDGFMAVFGAPIAEANASKAAVDAALEMVARVERLVRDGVVPPTTIGIGLHTGTAVVGNIGSADRKEYTVIGDVVNVASRIEALTKELGAQVLVSDATWAEAGRRRDEATVHDAITIRGRKGTMRVWQLA